MLLMVFSWFSYILICGKKLLFFSFSIMFNINVYFGNGMFFIWANFMISLSHACKPHIITIVADDLACFFPF